MIRICMQLIVIFILISVFTGNSYALFAKGKITIEVIGEDGTPVDGARVGIGFDDVRKKSKENSVIGFTDDKGTFAGAETTTSGYLAFNVTKDGYYKTTGDYQFKDRNVFGWEPWNPALKVVLRKIENPVPMYARNTMQSKLEIPVVNQNVGFDLASYDWVVPYGIGTHADLIFNLQRLPIVSRKNYDATLTITFSNKGDGFQFVRENLQYGSQFKLPRYARENGYESKLVLHEEYAPEGPVKQNFAFRADDLNYVFRIRSTEKDGKIERAMYGKTRGYISFTAMESKTAKIYFTYYLNPDYTRNLEFNPKRNLFGTLSDSEKVTEP